MIYCLASPLPIESTAMFSKSLQITAEPGAREGTRILHLNGPLDMETTLEFQRVVRAESSPTQCGAAHCRSGNIAPLKGNQRSGRCVDFPCPSSRIGVGNRDYHHLSQVEIAGDRWVYQQQSEGKTLGKGQALIVPQDSPGMDR